MQDHQALFHQALVPLLWMVAGIGLLACLVYWIRAWWRENDGPAASPGELLSEYREMNRRGELTDEEFRSIKSQIIPRIGQGATQTAGGGRSPTADPKRDSNVH